MNGVSKLTVTEDVALVTFNKLPADHKLIAGILDEFSKAEMNIDMISQTTSQGGDISFCSPCPALIWSKPSACSKR